MHLTREADYAIRTMLEVACHPIGTPTTTLQVSRRRLVPRPFVRKIVRRLKAAGLLRTRRGISGGLMLARPAEDITLLAVIDAAQGAIALNRCVLNLAVCALQPTCPLHEVCAVARAYLVEMFRGVRLSALLERADELRSDPALLFHYDAVHQADGREGTPFAPPAWMRRRA